MGDPLESSLSVHKVTDTKGEEHSVSVLLKGRKTIVHDTGDGYSVEDTAEITLTVKCGSMRTAKKLGIDEYGVMKLLSVRDRDASLSGYSPPLSPSMKEQIS